MDQAAFDDLKQFITATLDQQTFSLHQDIEKLYTKIDNLDHRLTSQISDLSNSVADALESSNQEVGKQLKNHETRISKLEKRSV